MRKGTAIILSNSLTGVVAEDVTIILRNGSYLTLPIDTHFTCTDDLINNVLQVCKENDVLIPIVDTWGDMVLYDIIVFDGSAIPNRYYVHPLT